MGLYVRRLYCIMLGNCQLTYFLSLSLKRLSVAVLLLDSLVLLSFLTNISDSQTAFHGILCFKCPLYCFSQQIKSIFLRYLSYTATFYA